MMASAAALARRHVQLHPGAHEAPGFQGLADQGQHIRKFGGLEDVFEGSQLGGLDGRLGSAIGRHDDDRQLGLHLMDGPEGLQAVHPRQAHVHDHQVGGFGLYQGQGRLTAGRGLHLVAILGQELFKALPQLRVVVHD